MAEYRNKKTKVVWDVTDPDTLKMIAADTENFEPAEKPPVGGGRKSGRDEGAAFAEGKCTETQKRASDKAAKAKDVNAGEKADAAEA